VLTSCVVLDLDDTLFLERDYVISGLRAVGRHVEDAHGYRDFADVAIALFDAGIRGTTFDQALQEIGVTPTEELIAELVGTYRTHAPSIALLPDAERLVAALQDRYVGVVTDGPIDSQRGKALAIGAPNWTDLIVYTAELGPGFGKPHPLGFSLHEARAGLPGERFTYIADNPTKDFAAPRARGWATIRIRRPLSLHADLDSGDDVDLEFASLDDVVHG
jgi:putative hydrolase of the HAD superfamily